MRKTSLTNTLELFYAKNGSKNTANNSKNESILKMAKNGHNANAIAYANYSLWVKKQNCLKHATNGFYKNIRVVLCQKTAPKNSQYSKNKSIYENGQKWPQCKGYSPCKILSLGQQMKLPKTCEKRLYKHNRVVLCKKRLQESS